MIALNIRHALNSKQAEAFLKAVIIYANKNNWVTVESGPLKRTVLDPQFGDEEPWKIAQTALKEAGLVFHMISIEEIDHVPLREAAAS